MVYELFGRLHAALATGSSRGERGQGTVEYVGLMLLLAGLLAGIIAVAGNAHGVDKIPATIAKKLNDTLDGITAAKGGGR